MKLRPLLWRTREYGGNGCRNLRVFDLANLLAKDGLEWPSVLVESLDEIANDEWCLVLELLINRRLVVSNLLLTELLHRLVSCSTRECFFEARYTHFLLLFLEVVAKYLEECLIASHVLTQLPELNLEHAVELFVGDRIAMFVGCRYTAHKLAIVI